MQETWWVVWLHDLSRRKEVGGQICQRQLSMKWLRGGLSDGGKDIIDERRRV